MYSPRAMPDPPNDRRVISVAECDLFCRCGRRNELTLRQCIACAADISKPNACPPPPLVNETQAAYVKRCGPILIKGKD
jgi:hypothetical protein